MAYLPKPARIALLGLICGGFSCREPVSPLPPPSSDSGAVTQTSTVQKAPPVALAHAPLPEARKLDLELCPGQPGWLLARPCIWGDHVYAVGYAPGSSSWTLGRLAAGNRARRKIAELSGGLVGETPYVLNRSEVTTTFNCKTHSFALVRAPSTGVQAPKCSEFAHLAPVPRKKCPAWVDRISWMEGDSMFGADVVLKFKQRNLAVTAAENRATTRIAHMIGTELKWEQDTLQTRPRAPKRPNIVNREFASCEGVEFMKVEMKF